MKRLSLTLSRKSLLTKNKSFVRPILDYADIIYDKPFNESFKRKIEMVQYRAALVITGAIKGTSRDRLYQELGLESLVPQAFFLSTKLQKDSYHLIFELIIMLLVKERI